MVCCTIPAFIWLGERRYIGELVVLLLAIGCYVNSIHGDFVHDDIFAIKDNQDLRPETPLTDLLVNDFWGTPMNSPKSHKSYRPLCVLTFRLNYLVSGLTPSHYHATNVFLHVVACLLVLYMSEEIVLRSRPLAVLTAALFAVHPVHTEAVTGIVGRADVLACILSLVSFILYERSCRDVSGTRWSYLILSVMGGGAAMLCKEQGVTVLGVCLIYDWLVVNAVLRKRQFSAAGIFANSHLLLRSIAVSLSILALLAFRLYMLNGQLPGFTDQDNPASFAPHRSTRFFTFSYLWAFNANLLTTPVVLSYDWQMGSIPLLESVADLRIIPTLVTFSTLTALAYQALLHTSNATQRVLLVSLGFLVLPFLPASNLFFRVGFVVAERILYLPSIGFCLLVVFGMNELAARINEYQTSKNQPAVADKARQRDAGKSFRSPTVAAVFVLLIVGMAAKTIVRNPVWWTRESLFRSGLAVVPNNAKVHYNYANFLKDTERGEEATQHYRTALRLYPNHASACNNLATLVSDKKEAEELYLRTTKLNPQHSRAYMNLGGLLKDSGRLQEAEAAFRQSLKIDENYGDALNGLAATLEAQGRIDEAANILEHLITLHPKNADYHHNLAVFYGNKGIHDKSLSTYETALKLNPNRHLTWASYARQLRQVERNADAERAFKRALKIERQPDTLFVFGIMLHNTNRPEEAERLYTEALQLQPTHYNATVNLAILKSARKEYGEAFKMLLASIGSRPSEILAYNHLMSVYAGAGKHSNVLAVFEEAVGKSTPTADTYDMHASSLHELKRTDDAIKSWSEAVRLNPALGRAHMNLGACYHLVKNYRLARHHYDIALKLQPGNAMVKDNLARLTRAEKKAAGSA